VGTGQNAADDDLRQTPADNVSRSQVLNINIVVLCFSACELSKEKPRAKWEIEADDGDEDFLCHTLFLKQVRANNR